MIKKRIRIIFYALLVYFVFSVFCYLYSASDFPFSVDWSNFIILSLKQIAKYSLAIVSGLLIFIWLENFSTSRIFSISLVIGLLGVTICVWNVANAVQEYFIIKQLETSYLEIIQPEKSNRLNEIMNDESIPLDRKANISYLMAKDEFENFGYSSIYINENGKHQNYIPKKSEVDAREKIKKEEYEALFSLQAKKYSPYYKMVFWISVIFTGELFCQSVGASILLISTSNHYILGCLRNKRGAE